MIDQIISALKISLAECNKYEEPARYIFELNEVLNRYKTNLYLAARAKYKMLQDPKEIFNARINLSWWTRPLYATHYEIVDRSPVLLHLSGFTPAINERINRERTWNVAVDITDIIDLDRIASVKTDWYDRETGGREVSPDAMFAEHPEVNSFVTSVYFEYDRTADGRIHQIAQIASVVSPIVERRCEVELADKMGDHGRINARSSKGVVVKETPASPLPVPRKEHKSPVRTLSSVMGIDTVKEEPKEQASNSGRFRSKDHLKVISAAKMNRYRSPR